MRLLLGVFLLLSLLSPVNAAGIAGISAIDWNGSTWLIGSFDGSLVSYDGKSFRRVANLGERILKMDHTSSFWLIGAGISPGRLVKYNGTLKEIGKLRVEVLKCSPEYCLIYAYTAEDKVLLRYDGENLTLIKKMEEPVREIHFNGEEWVILAGDAVYSYREDLLMPVRYEGYALVKLRSPLEPASVAWNGREWLIAGMFWAPKNETHAELLPAISYRHVVRLLPERLAKVPREPLLLRPASIRWNGSAWEICARKRDPEKIGKVLERTVVYDGKKFKVINASGCTPRATLKGLDRQVLSRRFSYVEQVECISEYCLILGVDRNGYSSLQRFDDRGFVDITPSDVYNVRAMAWNGSEWLVAATRRVSLFGKTRTVLGLYSYDGRTLKEMLSKSEAPAVSGVDSLAWNGSAWIIGITKPPEAQNKSSPLPGLLYFDGRRIGQLRVPAEGLPEDIYITSAIGWNGSTLLIALSDYGSPPVFLEYDGKGFRLVKPPPREVFLLPRPEKILRPQKLFCSERYCLLFLSSNRLVKFNGAFTRVNTSVEGNPIYALDDARWNGEYWLISYLIDPPSGGGFVAKYDGKRFVPLSEMPSGCPAGGMVWNGEYWLIGTSGVYCDRWALLKYDGAAFEDLTEEFLKAAEEHPEGRAICGPAAVLMLALIPPVLCRRRG
ncbi:MAG: hypothetical protein GXO66_06260 [Euryarchaeota archaeon]|nr:hypothetical protein [Euryarchaeota archaeon]